MPAATATKGSYPVPRGNLFWFVGSTGPISPYAVHKLRTDTFTDESDVNAVWDAEVPGPAIASRTASPLSSPRPCRRGAFCRPSRVASVRR